MVHPSIIEARLGELGFRTSRWFQPEIRELERILMPDEKIVTLACGRYFGSFALLVATDLRLLLIDKRVFFMTLEDTRYDMISEIDFNMQAYNATVTIYTMNKTHKFNTMKYRRHLRELTTYVQQRVWEIRQSGYGSTSPPPKSIFQGQRPRYIYSTTQPQPQLPSRPADYYAAPKPQPTHVIRERAGHVAHLVGSAATRAAHAPHLPARPVNPYLSGSMMTRQPIGGSPVYDQT